MQMNVVVDINYNSVKLHTLKPIHHFSNTLQKYQRCQFQNEILENQKFLPIILWLQGDELGFLVVKQKLENFVPASP